MQKISLLLTMICVLCSPVLMAETRHVVTVKSPSHRAVLLELYTSQGCSSCPPAERWLSELKQTGISHEQLIPLAFHVTYWDYIGWRDRFGSPLYDQRQRSIAQYNSQRTIYTPQFVLAGSDFRRLRQFSRDVSRINGQLADVDLVLSVSQQDMSRLKVTLRADTRRSDAERVAIYLALYEDNLSTRVEDGENEGELLRHDYVVRKLEGPFSDKGVEQSAFITRVLDIDAAWKRKDLFLVGFAQDLQSGEVLQAVRLKLPE